MATIQKSNPSIKQMIQSKMAVKATSREVVNKDTGKYTRITSSLQKTCAYRP
jgi:hypothetical protein